MRRLLDHWLHRFDRRAQEARLNRLSQHMATVNGSNIHFVHQSGNGPSPLPLTLTHGLARIFHRNGADHPLAGGSPAHMAATPTTLST
ncbi:epoxide hydrolase N-terminal domain-containing protein [Mesorhizobium silamurunense]|uniref:epoxide hydrolase N-terminal domain-containing protein n=1 Tax=Mesorhizobium silamurunense TaxID=499528 RepID=UPI001FE82CE8|nr:epoxide hydrolase N-terminal domain-containing protein [Mesorhizobium silamurunense]